MLRLLTRRGRLALTLAVVAAGLCVYALRDVRSVGAAFGIALAAETVAIGVACVIDAKPWRRRGRRVA